MKLKFLGILFISTTFSINAFSLENDRLLSRYSFQLKQDKDICEISLNENIINCYEKLKENILNQSILNKLILDLENEIEIKENYSDNKNYYLELNEKNFISRMKLIEENNIEDIEERIKQYKN